MVLPWNTQGEEARGPARAGPHFSSRGAEVVMRALGKGKGKGSQGGGGKHAPPTHCQLVGGAQRGLHHAARVAKDHRRARALGQRVVKAALRERGQRDALRPAGGG